MKIRIWVIFAVILVPVLLLFGYAMHCAHKQRVEIEQIRKLTELPTVASEPQNRAAHYLGAAVVVVPPKEDLLKRFANLMRAEADWEGAESEIQALLAANQATLELMARASAMPDCRMPILLDLRTDWSLRAVGQVLLFQALHLLNQGEDLSACQAAGAALQLGRDVGSAGCADQLMAGMHIHALASSVLARALRQRPLDPKALDFLAERLPLCLFPEDFDTWKDHRAWLKLIEYDMASFPQRLLGAANLEHLIRRTGPSQPTLGIHHTHPFPGSSEEDFLLWYPERPESGFDSFEGLSSGIVLLQIGTAAQRYTKDTGALPPSIEHLIPAHLAAVPDLPKWVQLVEQSDESSFEVSVPRNAHRVAPRTLRLEAARLLPDPPAKE